MGINANKKVKRSKVRINGNKNSTNNWGINAAGWNAVHKAVINAEQLILAKVSSHCLRGQA